MNAPKEAATVVDNLTMIFEDASAADRLTFDIETGELIGFLGPNRPRKTTTISLPQHIEPAMFVHEERGRSIFGK